MRYEVLNLETDESHGVYDTLGEARGCVQFDRLKFYAIWGGDYDADGEFNTTIRVECCEDDADPENIYGLPSIAQSIAEDNGCASY